MDAELTLRDYLELLRRRFLVVLVVLVVALTAALVWSAAQTPLYRSEARVLINQSNAAEIFDGQTVQATDRAAANEQALVESQLVRDAAQSRLGFEAEIDASVQSRADVITISAVDPDPFVAQQVARTYSEAYLEVRRQQYVEERIEVSRQLLDQLAEYDTRIASASEADADGLIRLRDELARQNEQLTVAADISPRASRIIDPATLPESPFSPRVARNLLLGGVLGAMLGVGAALLFESLDRSVRSREVIEELTPGVPSLAVVPVLKTNSDLITLAKPDGAQAEIFSTMRAALEFAAVDETIKVLQITSAGASAGKTTIAANLGVSMAQAGQKVALIDGDLRRPRLHEIFGLEQVPGLTSAMVGRETINTSARELRLDNGRLRVYPSGPIPPGPAELLGSQRARDVFQAIAADFDVLIIDSPPVLPVADALVISRLADATLLVANSRRTRRDDLSRSYDSLVKAGANVIGTVLNAAAGDALEGYGYGYGYGYGQASEGGLSNIFKRRKPNYAPRRAGTEVLERAELPKFEAARPNERRLSKATPTSPATAEVEKRTQPAGSEVSSSPVVPPAPVVSNGSAPAATGPTGRAPGAPPPSSTSPAASPAASPLAPSDGPISSTLATTDWIQRAAATTNGANSSTNGASADAATDSRSDHAPAWGDNVVVH